MIPLLLQLKNFLSYGATIQTVDFSHYPLICLSGKNGHGKSALLDAITWAVWGQARKIAATSKADEGLVRLGQTQMMVTLDFECENNTYRVKREYMITYGKAVASLEFGIYQDTVLVPLTEKTIRATQNKIENTLHLDYVSFTNSAFLRQGHSNEFSKKSPKERKEILATILGITNYDAIRKAAHDKARQAIAQQRIHMALQDKYAHELHTKNELETQIAHIRQELTDLNTNENQLVKDYHTCTKQYQEVLKFEHVYTQLQKEYTACTQQEDAAKESLRHARTQWHTLRSQLNTLFDIPTLKSEKEELIEKDQAYQKQFQNYATLKHACLEQEQRVYGLQKEIEQSHTTQTNTFTFTLKHLETDLARLEQERQETIDAYTTAKQEYTNISTALRAISITDTPSALDGIQKEQVKKTEEYHRTHTQWQAVQKEQEDTLHKLNLIRNECPTCPLCEQDLHESRKDTLAHKLHTHKQVLSAQADTLSKKTEQLKQELTAIQTSLELAQRTKEQERTHQQNYAELVATQKKTIQIIKHLKDKVEHFEKEIQQLDAALARHKQTAPPSRTNFLQSNSAYTSALSQMDCLQQKLNTTPYQVSEHELVRKRLMEIELHLQSIETRHEQEKQAEKYKQQIEQLCNSLRTLKEHKTVLETQIQLHSIHIKEKATLEKQRAILEEKINHLHQARNHCLEKKGRLANKQEALAQIEINYNAKQKELIKLEKEKHDYQLIATATGKDGIQALLIEHAIPEIEQEANAILSRLTDNQTTIMLESLRDLKKGGTKETLDIKISDASGIRPYELFSGGEAFRIDFALRIAISKLLARRAGSSMQTLVIDEGFGSQDEQGLTNIMEAIHTIQDDFTKIIIVSHLTSMKNQFPVHFVVHKHASGSEVQIIEQG